MSEVDSQKGPSMEGPGNRHWLRRHLFSLKTLSLVVLSVQTSTMVLLLRYSRTNSSPQPYIITTAVLLSELLKLGLSLAFLHLDSGKILRVTMKRLYEDVFLNVWETLKLAIPAFLYVVQNNLLFIALSNLDAATYQVTYQLKILTTAIFSWVMLGKRLAPIHWLSLCLLMLGVSLVQVDGGSSSRSTSKILPEVEAIEGADPSLLGAGAEDGGEGGDGLPSNVHNTAHPNPEVPRLLGILAVCVSCISSGFSGVYFERLVKRGKQTSLIIRNIQLGLFSIAFAVMAVTSDSRAIRESGFFQGYSTAAWLVVLIQAFGGLMVSVTMKYADNILKGFATSLSIVMSSLVSWLALGDDAPTLQFVIGASIVIASTFLYGLTPQRENELREDSHHATSSIATPHKTGKEKKLT
ncbi:UDP-N-acetylglucosamine transporter-like isoform X2 [Eriocheir sinensis]|uniref:UDP-N-acetylglucosamine transporter-like isoform X2 n=1 Tax=Eriocheir sinensis TaxID=95602 RepID=UPI0021C5E24C|nr:UDP-N-acetylglucosamine transporter-like isoform X2 [Eriocheir sinensis]